VPIVLGTAIVHGSTMGERGNAGRTYRAKVQAFPEKLNLWLSGENREPVQIANRTPDLSTELRRGLTSVRQRRKKVRK